MMTASAHPYTCLLACHPAHLPAMRRSQPTEMHGLTFPGHQPCDDGGMEGGEGAEEGDDDGVAHGDHGDGWGDGAEDFIDLCSDEVASEGGEGGDDEHPAEAVPDLGQAGDGGEEEDGGGGEPEAWGQSVRLERRMAQPTR